ncbi:ubiquitin carboxyl-terminal hydrolase 17 [Pyrus ussuriensis x Pyrus communis]|uniref:Ubiquitin carboxyl-terminal hydrolase 17 n=1 Tax=Pyrus ussuriensis x Pyrus communis TaxID=2448454 RepID=A0A5N5GW06_9ROSA|nr:ubiquitin carboxyl-terminal hydrolase 17 [Pyrus ussuriensis x Pyrus communis]
MAPAELGLNDIPSALESVTDSDDVVAAVLSSSDRLCEKIKIEPGDATVTGEDADEGYGKKQRQAEKMERRRLNFRAELRPPMPLSSLISLPQLLHPDSSALHTDSPPNQHELFLYKLFVKLYNWNKVELRPFGLINSGNK